MAHNVSLLPLLWNDRRVTSRDDVQLILDRVQALGLTPVEVDRRWNHIGAIIVDAALQPNTTYKTHVLPRVKKVVEEWPDADTLSGFERRLDGSDLSAFLNWRAGRKLDVVRGLTEVFGKFGVETVADLAAVLADAERRPEFRRALLTINGVGPKTIDYIPILAGSSDHVAVDAHIKGFARDAGIPYWNNYSQVAQLVQRTAKAGGWSTGALDAAIWNYMSNLVGARK